MRTIKLTVAYDGTRYAGWQVQPDAVTLQESLESALRQITGESVRTLASGRTDAGVHALGQVVSVRTESKLAPDVLQRALNAVLPHDMAVLDAAEVDPSFHPIRDAVRKRYRYTIHDGPVRDVFTRAYAWHYPHRLDAGAMHRAAQTLLGTHDFSAFETSGAPRKTSVRTITEISVRRTGTVRRAGTVPFFGQQPQPPFSAPPEKGDCPPPPPDPRALRAFAVEKTSPTPDFLVLDVEADGFLYNMVRAITGSLVEIGRGAQNEAWLGEVLDSADRRRAGPTAPPEGLCLVRVDYERPLSPNLD